MRDDLVGFVIGALDESEQQEIEQRLGRDADLQKKVELVRRAVRPLSLAPPPCPAPSSLAARTCNLVESHRTSRSAGAAGGAVSQPFSSFPGELSFPTSSWAFADFVVVAGICVAATCLVFPALINSRYHAQVRQCQHNMQQLGRALIQYSDLNGGYFPRIPSRGKLAVAGIYAPMLKEKSLLQDGSVLVCPSRNARMVVVRIPVPQEIRQAQGPQLVTLQRSMGGSYAYNLGFVRNGKLQAIRNQGRKNFVLAADASRDDNGARQGGHGRSQNVLFEDGHVALLASHTRPGSHDDFFVNDNGQIEAGMHPNDSVVASSWRPPLLITRSNSQ